jgi:hypothetical protein
MTQCCMFFSFEFTMRYFGMPHSLTLVIFVLCGDRHEAERMPKGVSRDEKQVGWIIAQMLNNSNNKTADIMVLFVEI